MAQGKDIIMNLAGIITMTLCWLFVTAFSVFLIVKTLRTPDDK
jgi:hypothetical protein